LQCNGLFQRLFPDQDGGRGGEEFRGALSIPTFHSRYKPISVDLILQHPSGNPELGEHCCSSTMPPVCASVTKIFATRIGASPAGQIRDRAHGVGGSAGHRLASSNCARNTSNGDDGVSSPMVNLLPHLV
jgi:hypothetical protein